jgi:hypothetical protein
MPGVSVVAYSDVFAAGLGFDIAGAVLVAKGLITPANEYAGQVAQSRNSFAWARVRAATDYADGRAGVIALGGGFAFQALGYALSIGGVSANTKGSTASVIAVAFTAAAILLTWLAARRTRWPLTRTYLVELAHVDNWGNRHDAPDGQELMLYADVLRRLPENERYDLKKHCRLTWKVEQFRDRTSPQG